MGGGGMDKNGCEKTVGACRNEDVSDDLFARLLIKRIVRFLEQRPSDFAITILPSMPPAPEKQITGEVLEEKGDGSTDNDNEEDSLSLESLSTEQRSLLESSVVLMHEPGLVGKSVGHLGLEAQHLPQIARILRKAYRQIKKKYQTVSDPSQTQTEELFRVTSCLLLIQPDHATAWADRRRCLLLLQNCECQRNKFWGSSLAEESMGEDGDDEANETGAPFVLWSRELDYLDILFTQHSKAPSSWAHRKYALRQILHHVEESYRKHNIIERANKIKDIIFAREVKTCIDVAEKYPKNYYAWTHRRYLWDLFSLKSSRIEIRDTRTRWEQREAFIQLLETELVVGMWQEWLQIHPADHSAVHYSCQVLDLLLNEIISLELDSGGQASTQGKVPSLSHSALQQVRTLQLKYSHENESLWILRRITYKILWKHLYFPSVAKNFPEKMEFFYAMASSVRSMLRKDLKSILSSTLASHATNDQQLQCDDSNTPNTNNIYAWTFLAWCMVNLRGLDGPEDEDNLLFTAEIRQTASECLTSNTETMRHNHLVYTSLASPILNIIATGTK